MQPLKVPDIMRLACSMVENTGRNGRAVEDVLDSALRCGFILREDRDYILRLIAFKYPSN